VVIYSWLKILAGCGTLLSVVVAIFFLVRPLSRSRQVLALMSEWSVMLFIFYVLQVTGSLCHHSHPS